MNISILLCLQCKAISVMRLSSIRVVVFCGRSMVFFLLICRFLCILYRSTIYGEQPMPISFIKIVEIFTFSLWLFLKSLEAHQLSKHTHHNLISFPLICWLQNILICALLVSLLRCFALNDRCDQIRDEGGGQMDEGGGRKMGRTGKSKG